MEQVGIEFFWVGQQAVKGTTDLARRFTNLDKIQSLAVKGVRAFGSFTERAINTVSKGSMRMVSGFMKVNNWVQKIRDNSKGMGSDIGKNLDKVAEKTKETAVSAFQIAKGFLMANVAMKGFNALMSSVPAIGQTFDQMGKVISANIIYPLVQEFIPILKDMMNWVKNNRVAFVQLGKVVANIFRAVWQAIKTIIDIGTKLFNRMWETVFGKGTMSFTKFMDFLNLMTLKIAFIVTFISLMLEPVFDLIARGFNSIWVGIIQPFLKGLGEGLGDIFDPKGEFMQGIGEFMGLMKQFAEFIMPVIEKMGPIFYFIGKILGGVIVFALKAAINYILQVAKGVKAIYEGVTAVATGIRDLVNSIIDWFTNIGNAIADGIMSGINSAKEWIQKSWVGKVLGKIGVDVGGGEATAPTGGGAPTVRPTGGGVSGGGGAGSTYTDNRKVSFEIVNPDPKQVAVEVQKKMDEKSNIKKNFQKSARMQGRD